MNMSHEHSDKYRSFNYYELMEIYKILISKVNLIKENGRPVVKRLSEVANIDPDATILLIRPIADTVRELDELKLSLDYLSSLEQDWMETDYDEWPHTEEFATKLSMFDEKTGNLLSRLESATKSLEEWGSANGSN